MPIKICFWQKLFFPFLHAFFSFYFLFLLLLLSASPCASRTTTTTQTGHLHQLLVSSAPSSFSFFFGSFSSGEADRRKQQQGSSELHFSAIFISLQVTIFGAKGLVIFNFQVLLQILSFLAWISWILVICSWLILFNFAPIEFVFVKLTLITCLLARY